MVPLTVWLVLVGCAGSTPAEDAKVSWLELTLAGEPLVLDRNAFHDHGPPALVGVSETAVQVAASSGLDPGPRVRAMLLVYTAAPRFIDYDAGAQELTDVRWQLRLTRGTSRYESPVYGPGPNPATGGSLTVTRDGLIVEGSFSGEVRAEDGSETLSVTDGRFHFYRRAYVDYIGEIDLSGGRFQPWHERQDTPADLLSLGNDPVSDAIRQVDARSVAGTWAVTRAETYASPLATAGAVISTVVTLPTPGLFATFSDAGVQWDDPEYGPSSSSAPTFDTVEGNVLMTWTVGASAERHAIFYWDDPDVFAYAPFASDGASGRRMVYLERVE